MDKVELEIVIISANDLKDSSNFGMPMHTHAVLWTDSTTHQSTQLDRHGGGYPTWNEKFQMPVSKRFLQQKGSSVVIQIYSKTLLRKKKVGIARMPYSDILEGYASPHSIQFLSYRVISPNGRRGGTIDLSVRFLDKINPSFGISTSQSEMKFPTIAAKPKTHLSWSNRRPQTQTQTQTAVVNGYAVGIPLSQFAYPQPQNPRGTTTLIGNSYSSIPRPLHSHPQNSINWGSPNTMVVSPSFNF